MKRCKKCNKKLIVPAWTYCQECSKPKKKTSHIVNKDPLYNLGLGNMDRSGLDIILQSPKCTCLELDFMFDENNNIVYIHKDTCADFNRGLIYGSSFPLEPLKSQV